MKKFLVLFFGFSSFGSNICSGDLCNSFGVMSALQVGAVVGGTIGVLAGFWCHFRSIKADPIAFGSVVGLQSCVFIGCATYKFVNSVCESMVKV